MPIGILEEPLVVIGAIAAFTWLGETPNDWLLDIMDASESTGRGFQFEGLVAREFIQLLSKPLSATPRAFQDKITENDVSCCCPVV